MACFVLWQFALPAAADSTDARFLEGLRERRLFELAETYAADRLARVQPGDAAQADLAIELVRTLALHAANSPAGERDALWAAARSTAAKLLSQSPPHPRAILVSVQDALTPLAQGELGRQEFEAGALPADELEPTRRALREAVGLLEALDAELTREVPLRRRTTPRPGELSADSLFSLHLHVQHQLARAQRNMALLFDRGSDDRLALLLAAMRTLERPLVQLPPEDPLALAIRLDLAECRRLLGRYDEAVELATGMDQESVDPSIRLRARAELIRTAVAQGDLQRVQRLLELGRTIASHASPELDFAWLEASLALARAAGDGTVAPSASEGRAAAAKRYLEQAAQTADFLEETYGAYWGRRADQLLVASLPREAAGGASAELLSRTADSLFLKGDFEQAISTYDAASAAARAATDLKAAFELAYKAALVEQRRGKHGAAATRLRLTARTFATHEQASQAHLLAAWNAAQAVRENPSATDDYVAILREHLATWPSAESANEARMWLGTLLVRRGDLPGAIDALSGVERASPLYPAAIAALASAWRSRLAELVEQGEATSERVAEAIRFFVRAIVGPENELPERWTEAERMAAVAAAELILAYDPARLSEAEGILRTAIEHSAAAPEAWQAEARALLVVALAGQAGRHEEALAELRSIGAASPESLLTVLDGLSQAAVRSRAEVRTEIARVQLAAVDSLAGSRGQLDRQAALTLDRVRAEALAAAGRRDEALAAYAQLVKANPNSGPIQRGYAELLLAADEPAQLQQALDQWRIVASRTKPRTPAWYEAKYSVALAQFKLGDRGGAATLLRYLLETPPGLKGSEWEAAYLALLRKCDAR